MSSAAVLRWTVVIVACAAAGAAAEFNAFVDNFDGPALDSRWGSNLPAGVTWSSADGNEAPGAMRIDGRTAAASVSVRLYSGRGFTAGPCAVSFYMKDSLGGATINVHPDLATSCAACGWWDYRSEAANVAGAFTTGWDQTLDKRIDDIGAMPNQWGGGTFRDALVNGLATDAQCPGSDTLDCDVVVIWRIRVSGGVVLFDDWSQSLATGMRPGTNDRGNGGWKRVTLSPNGQFPRATNYTVTILDASGQKVVSCEAFGNTAVAPEGLAAGSYVMRVRSEFGEMSRRLVVAR